MFAGADVIANGFHDGMIYGRPLIGAETIFVEQLVNWTGGDSAQKFSARIGTGVILGAGDVNGARRDEREEFVSIDWNFIVVVGVLAEISAEPVRKDNVEVRDRLTKTSAEK